MDYKNINYNEFVKKLPDFMTLYDIFKKYKLDSFVMSNFPGNLNAIDFNFHEYPYDEIYHTIAPTCQKSCTNELKLNYEYVLNREDFNESVEYAAMVLKGDDEKAEEVKQRILDKVAKRKQGYLEERGDDPVLDGWRRQNNEMLDRQRRQEELNSTTNVTTSEIPPGTRVLEGVKTEDGKYVLITDKQFQVLMDYLFESAQKAGVVDRERIHFDTIPDIPTNQCQCGHHHNHLDHDAFINDQNNYHMMNQYFQNGPQYQPAYQPEYYQQMVYYQPQQQPVQQPPQQPQQQQVTEPVEQSTENNTPKVVEIHESEWNAPWNIKIV